LVFFLLDLFDAVTLAVVDAGALVGSTVPCVGVDKVAVPEWPCAALVGTDGINFADPMAVDSFKKDAVIGRSLLDDGSANADTHEIFLGQFIIANFKVVGDKAYFLLCYPDISFFRAGTAFSALATLKMQAADIPWRFFSRRLHKENKNKK
jgi:hypothetical protein